MCVTDSKVTRCMKYENVGRMNVRLCGELLKGCIVVECGGDWWNTDSAVSRTSRGHKDRELRSVS